MAKNSKSAKTTQSNRTAVEDGKNSEPIDMAADRTGETSQESQARSELKTKIMIELSTRAHRVTDEITFKADRALLQVSERGSEIWKAAKDRLDTNQNDLLVKVSQTVLDRADRIRETLAEQKLVRNRADWLSRFLKDLSLKPKPVDAVNTDGVDSADGSSDTSGASLSNSQAESQQRVSDSATA